ncbi:MAG: RidA family protein [Rhodanobacteraceae bacterium]|nr:RidA family protein [Rhodanobacteraceae bacterium]
MSNISERLNALGIELPDVMPAVVDGYAPAFVPFVISGNQVHLSGRLGKKNGQLLCGKVGDSITLDEARLSARNTAIELLAVLSSAIGDLNRVERIVKLFVMVNTGSNFLDPHRVADGASELLKQVFGERGQHARSAIGVAQVPFGACVEIDLIVEISNTRQMSN